MKIICFFCPSLLIFASVCMADKGDINENKGVINCIHDYQRGSSFIRKVISVDGGFRNEGMMDAHFGKDPQISRKEMQRILFFIRKKIKSSMLKEKKGYCRSVE